MTVDAWHPGAAATICDKCIFRQQRPCSLATEAASRRPSVSVLSQFDWMLASESPACGAPFIGVNHEDLLHPDNRSAKVNPGLAQGPHVRADCTHSSAAR